MRRSLEVAGGIGVLLTSLLSTAAIFRTIFLYQQSATKPSLLSMVSLTVTGLAVLLSLVGTFILLSWASTPK